MTDFKFFAIVGVGRSGTTLLMSMLNAHPALSLPPETHFLDRYVVGTPNITQSELTKKLSDDHRFARLGIDSKDLMCSVKKNTLGFSAAEVYKHIFTLYASRTNVDIIGDKAPKNIEFLPVLKRIFPGAYLIHMIRDPRDVYLSRTKAVWSSSRTDLSHWVAYRAQYSMGRRLGTKLFKERYYEIHYEDLLIQPVEELEKISEFLGVVYEPQMLNFSESAQDLVFPEEMSWKKEALGPLLVQNKNKWKGELSREKVACIEAACGPTFKNGYYQSTQGTFSKPIQLLAYLTKFSTRILAFFYQQWVRLKNWRAFQVLEK